MLVKRPPEGSSRNSMIESHTVDRLSEYICNLDSKVGSNLNLIVCGDINARTSDLPDYVTDENRVHNDLRKDLRKFLAQL